MRAASSVNSLLPLWGRVGGGGRRVPVTLERPYRTTPTPDPSPQGGGERAECAAKVCAQEHRSALAERADRTHAHTPARRGGAVAFAGRARGRGPGAARFPAAAMGCAPSRRERRAHPQRAGGRSGAGGTRDRLRPDARPRRQRPLHRCSAGGPRGTVARPGAHAHAANAETAHRSRPRAAEPDIQGLVRGSVRRRTRGRRSIRFPARNGRATSAGSAGF